MPMNSSRNLELASILMQMGKLMRRVAFKKYAS